MRCPFWSGICVKPLWKPLASLSCREWRRNMYRYMTKVLLTIAFLFIGGVVTTSAQLHYNTAMNVYVPYSFVVKDRMFPAGHYRISRPTNSNHSSSVLVLRGDGVSTILNTNFTRSNQAAEESMLVFTNVGGTNFLSKILVKGETVGNQIPVSSRQINLMARNRRAREVVVTIASE